MLVCENPHISAKLILEIFDSVEKKNIHINVKENLMKNLKFRHNSSILDYH